MAILSGCFLGHLPVQSAQTWVEQGKMKPLFTEVHSYKVPFECVFPVGTRMANTERMLEEVMLKYSAWPLTASNKINYIREITIYMRIYGEI